MAYQQSEFLKIAISAAEAAAEVIKRGYTKNIEVQTKSDQTPVTAIDIEAEETIKRIISGHFPEHGFYGEETGRSDNDSEYLWLVDPIDGT